MARKERFCSYCNLPLPRGSKRKTCSPYCMAARVKHAAEQLSNHSGPFYDKWLQASSGAVARYAAASEKAQTRYKRGLEALQYSQTHVGKTEQILRLAQLLKGIDLEGL